MRHRIGRYDDALADFERAQALAAAARDRVAEVELLLDEAMARDWRDDYQRSEACVLRAQALGEGLGNPAIEARLLLGLGRSAHRFSREEEAVPLLVRAAAAAEALGDEGYETLVIATLLLGFILPVLNRLDEAGRALDSAVALCESHGDGLHLGPAINNRGMLRAFLGDKAGMIADFTRVLSVSRELGHDTLEIVGHYNLAEFLYLMDDLDAAEPHARRALELERRRTGGAERPVVALLGARIALYKGEEAEARAVAEAIRKTAAAEGGVLAVPSEDVLCAMIELATSGPDAATWDALEARSARFSVGQEHVEVLEARALAALRRGRRAEAARQLEKAVQAAARIPNVMHDRLERALAWIDSADVLTI
jgi:eukaryotic-like serine/threonine-protein kinase